MNWTSLDKLRSRPRLVGGMDAVVSLVLAVAFLASSIPHLGNPYYFLSSVYNYELVGPRAGQAAAMVLPILGLAVAACLLTGFWRDAAHVVAAGMVLTFAGVQIFAWVNEMAIPCGCLGPANEETIGAASLSTAITLVVMSMTRNILCLGASTGTSARPVCAQNSEILPATVS